MCIGSLALRSISSLRWSYPDAGKGWLVQGVATIMALPGYIPCSRCPYHCGKSTSCTGMHLHSANRRLCMLPSCSASSLASQCCQTLGLARLWRVVIDECSCIVSRRLIFLFLWCTCMCTAGTDRHLQLQAGESPHVTAAWSNDCACAD